MSTAEKSREQLLAEINALKQQNESLQKRLEKSRKDDDHELNAMLHIGILHTDLNGKIINANPKMLELSGYRDLSSFMSNCTLEDLHIDKNSVANSVENKIIKSHVTSFTNMNDENVDIAYTASYDKSKEIYKIFLSDLSYERSVEKDLKLNLTKYQVLFRELPIGISITDSQGNLIETNPRAEKLLGISEEEHNNRSIDSEEFKIIKKNGEIFPPSEYPSVVALKKNIAVHEIPMGIVKGESVTWINVSVVPIDHKDLGVVISYDNITKQIVAQEMLSKERVLLETLINTSPDIIIFKDRDLKYQLVNDALCKFLNKSREELIGKSDADFAHPGEKEIYRQRDMRVLSSKQTLVTDEEVTGANQKLFFNVIKIPVFDSQGNTIGILINMRDITKHKETEIKLRQREAKLEAIFNSVPDGLAVFDTQGILIETNDVKAQIYGFKDRKELIGINAFRLISPEDVQQVQSKMELLLREGGTNYARFNALKKNGQTFPVEMSYSLLKDKVSGELIGIVTITKDISHRVAAEKALEKSESMLRSIIKAAPIGICVVEKNKIQWCNKTFSDIVGYSSDELYNQDVKMLLSKESFSEQAEEPGNFNFLNSFDTSVSKWVKSDGSVIDVLFGSARLNPAEENSSVVLTVLDTTEQLKIQSELRQSEEKFRVLTDKSRDGIIIFNKRGKIINANRQLSEMLAKPIEQINGMWIWDLVYDITPDKQKTADYSSKLREKYSKFLLDEEADWTDKYYDTEIVSPSGGIRYFQNIVFGIDTKSGFFGSMIMKDITESYTYELKLKNLNKELEDRVDERTELLDNAVKNLRKEIEIRKNIESELISAKRDLEDNLQSERDLNLMKTRFISMISHEYRTPLTIILSSTHLLENYTKEISNIKIDNHLKKIKSGISALTGLLDNVTSISKLEDGNIDLMREDLDIVELCRNLFDDISTIDNQNHDLQFISNSESHIIYTDKKIIKTILFNLLNNAIKYSAPNTIVKLELEISEELVIQVKDQGFGFTNVDKKHLYEPFYRGKKSIGIVPGTGLGLALVKRYSDLMNIRIDLKSEDNIGSDFTLYIPKS